MAAFCVNCGAPLAEGVKFCNKCGAAVQAAPAAPVSVAPAAPPSAPAPGGSNTIVKVIIGVLAVLMFLGLVVAGSCFYIGIRFKKKAHELSREMGGEVAPYKGKREPCAMLNGEEVSQALGQPVVSVEQHGLTNCEYHFGPGGNQRFAIDYTWESGAMTFKLSHAAMKSVSGMETFTPVQGIGDEAYIEPMGSGLLMRKGDVMVNLDLRVSGVSVDAAKTMAAKIADRLH